MERNMDAETPNMAQVPVVVVLPLAQVVRRSCHDLSEEQEEQEEGRGASLEVPRLPHRRHSFTESLQKLNIFHH